MSQDPASQPVSAEASAAPSTSKAMRMLMIGTPIALLLLGGVWFVNRNHVSTDDAQVDGHLVPVSSRVYGSVEKVLVEDNQAVKAGDPLVAIDPRDIQARLDQTKAALAQAKAQVEGARAELERGKVAYQQARGSDQETAQANLDARKASLDKARKDVQRMKPLAEREEISAQQYDGYRTQSDVADGEWRDYAMDFLKDRAVFSVFRRSTEYPLYRIEKNPKYARKQGAYSVVSAAGHILKRGHELARVLAVLEKPVRLVV